MYLPLPKRVSGPQPSSCLRRDNTPSSSDVPRSLVLIPRKDCHLLNDFCHFLHHFLLWSSNKTLQNYRILVQDNMIPGCKLTLDKTLRSRDRDWCLSQKMLCPPLSQLSKAGSATAGRLSASPNHKWNQPQYLPSSCGLSIVLLFA